MKAEEQAEIWQNLCVRSKSQGDRRLTYPLLSVVSSRHCLDVKQTWLVNAYLDKKTQTWSFSIHAAMDFCCALFAIDFYILFLTEVMQARGHISKGERTTHQRPTHFFSKVGLNPVSLWNAYCLSPLSVPHHPITFGEIGRHGQPWQHNVQSNILEIHVGVSIAITTLIKASHTVQPEEQYFSLTAKPPPELRSSQPELWTVTPQISTAHISHSTTPSSSHPVSVSNSTLQLSWSCPSSFREISRVWNI